MPGYDLQVTVLLVHLLVASWITHIVRYTFIQPPHTHNIAWTGWIYLIWVTFGYSSHIHTHVPLSHTFTISLCLGYSSYTARYLVGRLLHGTRLWLRLHGYTHATLHTVGSPHTFTAHHVYSYTQVTRLRLRLPIHGPHAIHLIHLRVGLPVYTYIHTHTARLVVARFTVDTHTPPLPVTVADTHTRTLRAVARTPHTRTHTVTPLHALPHFATLPIAVAVVVYIAVLPTTCHTVTAGSVHTTPHAHGYIHVTHTFTVPGWFPVPGFYHTFTWRPYSPVGWLRCCWLHTVYHTFTACIPLPTHTHHITHHTHARFPRWFTSALPHNSHTSLTLHTPLAVQLYVTFIPLRFT